MKKTVILMFCMLLILTTGCIPKDDNSDISSETSTPLHEVSKTHEESVFQDNSQVQEDMTSPKIQTDKTAYSKNDTIIVSYTDTDTKDWIGVYPAGSEPGSINSLIWDYSVGSGTVSFSTASLTAPATYWIFLCDNDGYEVLDIAVVTLSDNDENDYGVEHAEVTVDMIDGISRTSIEITPNSSKTLTYNLYWADENGRLTDYAPLYTATRSDNGKFTVDLNDGIYMPDEAEFIEVSVLNGKSTSFFVKSPEILKKGESKKLFSFNVITDMHIVESRPLHTSHLQKVFNDILELDSESIAIFTCGDNTDRGTANQYDILMNIIESAGDALPDVYFAMGNHDLVYGNGFESQVELFKNKTGMDGVYYSVELNGMKFIVLGSDTLSATGTVGKDQLDWLKNELSSVDKSKPVFLFLHQPLIDTVSGSLYSKDTEIQDWYGIIDTADEIRAILADFPNAFLFTGHTHWQLESMQTALLGYGKDANFINCASVGYLWNDLDTSVGGSQAYFVEVYEDYVLLRGREFVQGKWCACAQFKIPLIKE